MREFGSEFNIDYARDYYFDNLAKSRPYFSYTRSGREAIALAAEAMGQGVVLIPAYCCWSMELPFEKSGWQVEYYRLNEDLSVDLAFLAQQMDKFAPKAVLVMNYFGFVPTDDVVSFVKKHSPESYVIEDFTQCLFWVDQQLNPAVDAYVASIRKSVGVPDGGLIMSSLPLKTVLLKKEDTLFSSLHRIAGREKTCYGYSADAELKAGFRDLQGKAGTDIKENYGLYQISEEARSVVEHTIVDNVRYARQANYAHLYSMIADCGGLKVLFEPSDNNKAPFMMIVLSENRDEFQKALAQKGVYAQLLWPLKDKAKALCPVSKKMEEQMLAIPIDQRYNWDDIEEIGNIIKEVLA